MLTSGYLLHQGTEFVVNGNKEVYGTHESAPGLNMRNSLVLKEDGNEERAKFWGAEVFPWISMEVEENQEEREFAFV